MNRHIKRRIVSGLSVVAATVMTLTACGGSGDSDSKSSGSGKDYGLIKPGTINAAVTAGDFPWASPDQSGKPVGLLIDLNELISKRMGLKITYKTTTVQAGLPALTSGQYDMLAIGLVATPERKKSVAFTKPIFWGTNVIVVPNASKAKTLDDFTGKRVGAGANSTQEDFAKKKLTKSKLVSEPTDSVCVSQLLAGNLDACVLGSTHVGKIYDEHPGKLKSAVQEPQEQPGAMAVNKKLTTFLAAYNKQLTALADDGTFLKLYEKYFPNLPFPTAMYDIWPSIKKQVEAEHKKAS
ncbi:ABC transporter substrate-binding protein [Streptomyces sp. TS71-3]|uniref:substrate-binding periplasmic protein n=1 Tax=Streptomyces sp. TS71-3 TaxID=2733862 RepID=UPI001B2744CB|nr:transporter substrate-binding domain-containing protein [Streptomyces sp. TS71-3]GHJ39310.1 amino acid ABC transporter substrate-binding protein [Streptomyces sp. TS71-3]